jgi:hypothetical protein
MAAFGKQAALAAATLSYIVATQAVAAPAIHDTSHVTPQAVQAAIDCRKLADGQARLACYDKAVDALGQALDKGEVVAVDQGQVQQVRRQAFGFTLPSLTVFDRGAAKGQDVDEVTLTIESARLGPDGKWVLGLEGGQVWRQIESTPFSRTPKAGAKATIRRALLGSYLMTVGGKSGVRVHRDQ